ncbi:TusE/DsrC/DsvC family sulfur relay protein [Pokkaliibacter sp. CJK22405]|uniref:TusE/DsrC/DsvC family sulfur relay protein n=1 Tax=Pokkaliibacter sp. CJK22405 TaxID=3384615 RepID=UPI0039853617
MSQHPALDPEGYLVDLADWNENTAEWLAAQENISLTPAHWEILHLLRDFYREFGLSPATRPLIKTIGQRLGKDKGNSLYVMKLFPESPAKLAAKLAGLPKPTNCL